MGTIAPVGDCVIESSSVRMEEAVVVGVEGAADQRKEAGVAVDMDDGQQLLDETRKGAIVNKASISYYPTTTYMKLAVNFYYTSYIESLIRVKWKEINLRALGWICLNSCVGYAMPTCINYYGLQDTTPSYAAIFFNIIPLITFILSIILRMEKLQFGTATGTLTVVGVLLAVGGTMIVSFYKGKALHLWGSILQHHRNEQVHAENHHVRGTILMLGSSFTFACWYPIQSMVNKVYPYKYWSTTLTCFLGGLQTTIIGIILQSDRNTWKLGWDLQLLTIVFAGVFATAVKFNLESWTVAKRGPAYPTIFIPLILVFTTVLDSIFLGDTITIGSLLGAATVITGLYIFLWGKSKELPKKEIL